MSVQSEIERIAGAKSDIATAITNKGVTVPSGTKLDGMAALIDSIESGGGGGGSGSLVTPATVHFIRREAGSEIGEFPVNYVTYTKFYNNFLLGMERKANVTEITDCYVGGYITLKAGQGCEINLGEGVTQLDNLLFLQSPVSKIYIDKPCYIKNTKILLSDWTEKPVQDISYYDDLLAWDFDNGCYVSAKPLWIKKSQTTKYYYRCTFKNGIVLNLVGSNGKCHRVYDADMNRFEWATDCVGHNVMTTNGITELVSCERVDEPAEFYNIITEYHINLYAEKVLTSCRLNNLYPIQDMKFIKETRPVIPIDSYDGIEETFYRGLRLFEHEEEEKQEINKYVHKLYTLMKPKH